MYLEDYLDLDELKLCLEAGTIREAKHEFANLRLYTYTEKAQFAGEWLDAERKCRGLVTWNNIIIGRCMPKFFNYSEHTNGKSYTCQLPVEDFKVYSKMDGSMGTVFFFQGSWLVATKGSFHSDQAKWANEYLASKNTKVLNPRNTYVVEIIYPENRIVVDYGSKETLVLLTVYDNKTGQEVLTEETRLEWGWIGEVVPEYELYGIQDLDGLQEFADLNLQLENDMVTQDREVTGSESEGYVVRFESGLRVKVKMADYLRLHKIVTNCTKRSIWEAMAAGSSLNEYMTDVPDEFHSWVIDAVDEIESIFVMYKDAALLQYADVLDSLPESYSRRDFAELAKEKGLTSALFLLLDGKDDKFEEWCWKMCKPEHEKAFTQSE